MTDQTTDDLLEAHKLAKDLNRDVVTLQQAMMTIWDMAGDDVKRVVEDAMASTGMSRVER